MTHDMDEPTTKNKFQSSSFKFALVVMLTRVITILFVYINVNIAFQLVQSFSKSPNLCLFQNTIAKRNLMCLQGLPSVLISDGLDAETLGALGDVQELNSVS